MEHTVDTLYNLVKEQVEEGKVEWSQVTSFGIYKSFLQDPSGVESVEDLDLAIEVFDKIQEEHIFY